MPSSSIRRKARGLSARRATSLRASGTHELTLTTLSGDAEALTGFYEAWFDRAFVLARALTRRDESFCLDVVQDARMRVVRSLPPLEEAAALGRWMVRVVHTTALDLLLFCHDPANICPQHDLPPY